MLYICHALLCLFNTQCCNMSIRQFGLQSRYVFNSLSDSDLDDFVRSYSEGNDSIGPNAVRAILLSKGIKV